MVTSDLDFKDATNALVTGSFDEDFQRDKDPVGGYRSLNHFYDPLDNTSAEGGLSDFPPDIRWLQGKDSLTWATVSNGVGMDISYKKNTKNIWSWQNARGYEWLGLTATTQSERQENLDNMFRAVGQVMHLLEDTTQPQHVRNEQHLG